MARLAGISTNLAAFLDMLAHSEGTSTVTGSDDGYNVLVGGKLFYGYVDHPRVLVKLNDNLFSTAAGRYQVLARYFKAYAALLHLQDFKPEAQDRIAIQQLTEARALPEIEAGRFASAVALSAHLWASLPGAGYGQYENSMSALQQIYLDKGGSVAES